MGLWRHVVVILSVFSVTFPSSTLRAEEALKPFEVDVISLPDSKNFTSLELFAPPASKGFEGSHEIYVGDAFKLVNFVSETRALTARGALFLRFVYSVAVYQQSVSGRLNLSLRIKHSVTAPDLLHSTGPVMTLDFTDPVSGAQSHDIDSGLFDPAGAWDGSYPMTSGRVSSAASSDEANMSGICGVISTAYSLVYNLQCIDKEEAIDSADNQWKDDFLSGLKGLTADPTRRGSTNDDLSDMHRRHPKLKCSIDCDEEDTQLEYGDDIEAFCKRLAARMSRGADCPLGFHSSETERGHSVYLSAAMEVGGGRCAFLAQNTAKQGNRGKDVPITPPLTRVVLSSGPGNSVSTHFDLFDPSEGWQPYSVLNNANYDSLDYRCCWKRQQ